MKDRNPRETTKACDRDSSSRGSFLGYDAGVLRRGVKTQMSSLKSLIRGEKVPSS